jgi:hypothetical protein
VCIPSQIKARIPWPVLRTILVRLAKLAVLVACSLGLWWSVSRRLLPASEQVRRKTAEMTRLANDVQQLELNWNPKLVAETDMRFAQTRQHLFLEETLAQWQKEIERKADTLALQPLAQLGRDRFHLAGHEDLALQPLSIDLRPLEGPATTNSAYRRLIQFAQMLQPQDKRVDLVDLSVSANSNSVQQAKFLLNLWMPTKPQL